MVDEVQVPPAQRFFVCPCCVFSFTERGKFIAHCERMKEEINAAIVSAKFEKKAKK